MRQREVGKLSIRAVLFSVLSVFAVIIHIIVYITIYISLTILTFDFAIAACDFSCHVPPIAMPQHMHTRQREQRMRVL